MLIVITGLYNQPPGYNIFYTHLPSTSLIWTYARNYGDQG